MDISEEKLQNMQINVDKLRKKQEKSAGDVAAARAEYETRKTTYIGSVRKLQERLGKSVSSITEQSSVTEMDHVLENWKQQLEEELNKLKKDAKLLAKLREALQNIEEQRRKLRETYTQCMTEEKEAAEKLAGSEATLKNLKRFCRISDRRSGKGSFASGSEQQTACGGNISEGFGRSKRSCEFAKAGRDTDRPLSTGNSDTETVRGRTKNFLYRNNEHEADGGKRMERTCRGLQP